MVNYMVRRLLQALLVMFLVSVGLFALINSAPGDPVTSMLSADPNLAQRLSDTEELERQRKALGLDQPWPVRYVLWLQKALQGELGHSYVSRRPVAEILGQHLVPTLVLMSTATGLALLIGVPLGILAALRQYSLFDQVSGTVAFMGISVPGFYLAILVLYLFSLRFPIFPSFGMRTMGGTTDLPGWLDILWHLALPAGVLAFERIASYMRYMRSAVQDVMRTEYVRMAHAKGVSYWRAVWRHMFPNALLPLVTLIGLSIPGLFGGAVLIERIFAWPGLGFIGVDAVARRDYLLVMGFNLMISALVLLSNLVTDLVYAYVDPRIRLQ